MKKKLTFLLALTFLFLFSGCSVEFADDFQKGQDAHIREDYSMHLTSMAVILWMILYSILLRIKPGAVVFAPPGKKL